LRLSAITNLYEIAGDEYANLGKAMILEKHIARHLLEFSAMAFLTPNGSVSDSLASGAARSEETRSDRSLSDFDAETEMESLSSQDIIQDLDHIVFNFPEPENDPLLINYSEIYKERRGPEVVPSYSTAVSKWYIPTGLVSNS
jgi:hypothetical protein